MTFLTREQSAYDGLPQEMYLFEYLGEEFAYTSSRQAINFGGRLYEPIYIKRNALKNENDMFKTIMKVTIPVDNPVALLYRTWMEGYMMVTVFRKHYGDADADSVILWSGKVSSCEWKGNEAELSCTPLYSQMKVVGLLRTYQRSCPHIQYGDACRLDRAIWEDSVEVLNIDGTFVQFSGGYNTNYFKGGSATIGVEKRWIAKSDSSSITVTDAFVDAKIGDTMKLLPGCQHSASICRNTFNNELNNGGFYFIPSKNPFMVTILG